jgi:hypothetical protein
MHEIAVAYFESNNVEQRLKANQVLGWEEFDYIDLSTEIINWLNQQANENWICYSSVRPYFLSNGVNGLRIKWKTDRFIIGFLNDYDALLFKLTWL